MHSCHHNTVEDMTSYVEKTLSRNLQHHSEIVKGQLEIKSGSSILHVPSLGPTSQPLRGQGGRWVWFNRGGGVFQDLKTTRHSKNKV